MEGMKNEGGAGRVALCVWPGASYGVTEGRGVNRTGGPHGLVGPRGARDGGTRRWGHGMGLQLMVGDGGTAD